jgi:phytoene synthase
LDLVYAGAPRQSPVDRAFAATVARHKLPRILLDALIEGFEWDASKRRYRTLSDVRAYSARVAATVGAMMTVLMEATSAEALARACDLGVAMQLTNIARDVGEDARAGRLYLPLDWFDKAGIDPDAWLKNPRFEPAIAGMVARLLSEADRLYQRAGAGIKLLPRDSRTAIWAARHIYSDIGTQIQRRGLDSVNARAVVSKKRKALLLAKAALSNAVDHASLREPALAETAFLVEAAHRQTATMPRPGFKARLVWTLELFERLERAERARMGHSKANTSVA